VRIRVVILRLFSPPLHFVRAERKRGSALPPAPPTAADMPRASCSGRHKVSRAFKKKRQARNAVESSRGECGHLLPFDHTAYCIAAALFHAMAAAEQRETFAARVCHATGCSAGHAADENY
jgi:hypothetical protein